MPREKEGRFWGEAGASYLSSASNEVKVWGRWRGFLLVDCCGWVVFLGSACVEICWRWVHWGNVVRCVSSKGRNLTAREPPRKHHGLTPMVNIRQITSAKSRSERGESNQSAFMNSCLTISQTCLPCLPSRQVGKFPCVIRERGKGEW